jgi:hypothetical protein
MVTRPAGPDRPTNATRAMPSRGVSYALVKHMLWVHAKLRQAGELRMPVRVAHRLSQVGR